MLFLLDENIHRGLLPFLIELGHDVKLSPKGATNGEVFSLAISEKRILINQDFDFANFELYPPSKHFGITLVRIPSREIETLKTSLSQLLAKKKSPEEFARKLFLLEKEKFKII